jgi:hypothetical protein
MKIFADRQRASPVRRIRTANREPARVSDRLEIRRIVGNRGIQRKLTIGEPNDTYEQEADQVADRVMRLSDADIAQPDIAGRSGTRVQRLCSTCAGEKQAVEDQRGPVEAGHPCPACRAQNHVQTKSMGSQSTPDASAEADIHRLQGGGSPLDSATREYFEPRFGRSFADVRIHSGSLAARAAQGVQAKAFTLGKDVVFNHGEYQPNSESGKRLLGHELTHVIQQGGGMDGVVHTSESPVSALQRRAAPYIKKITVHLTPPQSADLEWQGTAPTTATGSDHFTVSTGKGYSNPGDPEGTCTRDCCADAATQCAAPWNEPGRTGACCTYVGSTFWTGRPLTEHNGWQWWTPIQPYYSRRGIALHQHTEVTGQPIGHGCVRMDEPNAKRIYNYSNRHRTNVTIDGDATPVACEASRRCAASGGSATTETPGDGG